MIQREKLIFGLLLALSLGLLCVTVLGRQGLREVSRLKRERAQLGTEIEGLRERRLELERQIADLRNNPKAIESRARKDLGMIRPGETVILVPERHGERR